MNGTQNATQGTANEADERYYGTFRGNPVSFKRDWGGHHFTDDECIALLNGETITIDCVGRNGFYQATGALAYQKYKERIYFGFKREFPKSWCGHEFTDDERNMLKSGGEVYAKDFVSRRSGRRFPAYIRYNMDTGSMAVRF